ncbi:hypothetical protein Saro_3910 (plasmid) [Novosphingobium aromaticivorans DSM 12444]|uniref:Uncharacterized protein n=2 Tax=Novosphingobium aromaticivorans TaxID=48935 RepID=A4XDZ2_NOVAD|nr:unknown [Novosphingobium aromaticivorans]ABP64153.1 hypothetical protein Saro_3910 [Novosphingobium aromaticivorans DSM 12444]
MPLAPSCGKQYMLTEKIVPDSLPPCRSNDQLNSMVGLSLPGSLQRVAADHRTLVWMDNTPGEN